MTTAKFISYVRVSTDKQGRSGLGLEAQRQAVNDFIASRSGRLIGEFVEVESGKRDDRPKLKDALHRAKVTGATLVIAKLDRLSRNLRFIADLQEGGVRFVCADMPDANELTIHLFAAIAQHERKIISERTRNAMRVAKAKGRVFGNPNGARALRGLGNKAAVAAIKANADEHARDILPVVEDIQAGGVTTLKGIAEELNARGIMTARDGRWYAATVRNLLSRSHCLTP
ncbi:MAG TPA: recombinase family protein [Stellaceae bacterium]|nr:recombinase family protein [Stellaceae bacterium]